jgi:hypothetical protein
VNREIVLAILTTEIKPHADDMGSWVDVQNRHREMSKGCKSNEDAHGNPQNRHHTELVGLCMGLFFFEC